MERDSISAAGSPATHVPDTPRSPDKQHRKLGRVRVTRACDRCKKRKTRCTGLQPCRLCVETASACAYTAAYYRGRQPVVPFSRDRASLSEASRPRGHDSDQYQGSFTPARHEPDAPVPTDPRRLDNGSADLTAAVLDPAQPSLGSTEPVSRASPEPTQTDLEGHYVGPSSGVSFLLRVQKRLDQSMSFPHGSSIFTFGDAPLPHVQATSTNEAVQTYSDPTFGLMLSKDDTTRLLQRYFDFVVPVDRFLHRPTIEAWYAEFYETMGMMRNKSEAPTRTALLFMVFALAQQHISPKPTALEAEMSVRYFQAANQQLSREQGAVCLASVQARLCQCLWLLSESRINQCWNLFGTVARLAFAIGLHRQRHAESLDLVEVECRRRTFWCAYTLDNYISTALGRPRTFHDDDIDQVLPSCVDDQDVRVEGMVPNLGRGQSIMHGPVAYFKLSRILSGILRDIYSIRPTSSTEKHRLTAKYTKDLKAWRADMSRFLDPDANAAPLIPIFQRQRNVLNLAYWHTMILTHRPLLLSNFARLRTSSKKKQVHTAAKTDESVRECLEAAVNIVGTVNDIIQAGQLYRAFWFTPYFAFSASVILYVYTIQKHDEPEHTYSSYFTAATRCQNQLADIAESGSLMARYCLILQELRMEAIRQIENTAEQANGVSDATMNGEAFAAGQNALLGSDLSVADVNAFGGFDFNVSPSDSLAEMTSWGHFDSMVIPGFSGLESLLGNDRFSAPQGM